MSSPKLGPNLWWYRGAMQPKTSVKGGRIVIDSRSYDARVLGGGRFDVFTTAGVRVGQFSIRNRVIEAEDLGVDGADPVAEIGRLWMEANLSAAPAPKPAPAPVPDPAPSEPAAAPSATTPSAAAPSPSAPAIPPAPASQSGPTPGRPTWPLCRIATHARPDAASFKRANAYAAWLRTQPGVLAAYVLHDTASGKTTSMTIWETPEQLSALRYSQPPKEASPLPAIGPVEQLWVVG